MKYSKYLCVLLCSFSILIAGCSKEIPPSNYDASEVGKIKKVVPGVIISMRQVNIEKQTDSATPTSSEYADANITRTRGFEYVIKLDSGTIISLVQNEDLYLKTKQRILVIYGNNTRIVPDDGS